MHLNTNARFSLLMLILLVVLTAYAGCGGRDLLGDIEDTLRGWFGPRTERTKFRRQLAKSDTVSERTLALWDTAYAIAKTTPLRTELPHREVIYLDGALPLSAQAVRFTLPPGRRLRVRYLTEADAATAPLFGELYRLTDGRTGERPRASWSAAAPEITYRTADPARGEELLLLVQTAPRAVARYELQLLTEPTIAFPVAGKDEAAIQSFWGAPRDGGRRKHEGNDVFAPRGTDLLAVAEGTVSRTGNGGLGGKTVWLRDPDTGLRYYYAHLDEQRVSRGQYVSRGQVVGTVGNTGNARTTPPHLHFGIYAGGAIDPYPFLQRADDLPPPSPLPLRRPAQDFRVPARGNHFLRLSPARDGFRVRRLDNGAAVRLLGVSGRFYRVETARGETGYVNFD